MYSQLMKYLIINGLISQSHQGGISGHNSTLILVEMHEYISEILSKNKYGALVTLDTSAAYDIVNHDILKKKLKNIVVKFSSVDLIMSFLSNQRQYTEVNANTSEIINNENIGVFQGSSLSGILYLIYNLDINLVTHSKKHKK